MPVIDVLDWLDRRELRGQLSMERGEVIRRLHVAYGCLTGASSNDPAEYLGQLLINAGHLTEEQLRAAYQNKPPGVSLGKILLRRGQVTEEQLRQAIELKIRESVAEVVAWTGGAFIFDPEVRPPAGSEYEVALPLRDVVMEGTARIESRQRVRSLIPSDSMRFFVVSEAGAADGMERKLVEAVGRGLSVRDVVLEHHALPFPILERLASLVERGVIQSERRSAPRDGSGERPSSAALLRNAQARAQDGDKMGALALAKRALQAAPDDDGIKRAHAVFERAVLADLSRTLLGKYRVPRLARPPAAGEELSSEERYFLGRIDGKWDLLSLMRVSPLRELEALLTIHRLAARGLIALD